LSMRDSVIGKPYSKSAGERVVGLPAYTPCCVLFVESLSESFPLGVRPHLAWGCKSLGDSGIEKIGGGLIPGTSCRRVRINVALPVMWPNFASHPPSGHRNAQCTSLRHISASLRKAVILSVRTEARKMTAWSKTTSFRTERRQGRKLEVGHQLLEVVAGPQRVEVAVLLQGGSRWLCSSLLGRCVREKPPG
jgi:hypothetical protein